MKWRTIFNPFEKFSENKLMITGVLASLAGILIAWLSGQTNDGVYHISVKPISLLRAFTEIAVIICLVSVLLFILGKFINRRTRYIDLLNAVMIHKIPLIIGLLITSIPFFKHANIRIIDAVKTNTLQKINSSDIFTSAITGILLLFLFVYAIVLLVNGFKTATNGKKAWHYIAFALALIISEFIYRGLLYKMIISL